MVDPVAPHLQATLDKILGEAETALAELSPAQRELGATVLQLSERAQCLKRRAEDTEGRNRRNNARIIGLPEGAEGADMVAFWKDG
ncbi:hypothetical protein NDU88_005409 [Pleurodeles waltl]|uniref:Uncharacterized protein n=1 Tax=Pleurodeles waltl TaxID=8319 RepID=A0AAV7SLU4_PLEWA|nr:hypothetical protein NDU88_005409 [Pleurodeles waltl]